MCLYIHKFSFHYSRGLVMDVVVWKVLMFRFIIALHPLQHNNIIHVIFVCFFVIYAYSCLHMVTLSVFLTCVQGK